MHVSFLEGFGGGLLIAAWLLWGSIMLGNSLVKPDNAGIEALRIVSEEGAPAASAPAAEEEADALALLAAADPAAGKKVFRKCAACHTPQMGGKNKVGPNLWDVVGRPKASASGFKYSGALAGLGDEWTYEDLDAFLTSPKSFAKGNKMTFRGLKKAADRAAVIAHLRSLSDQPKPLP